MTTLATALFIVGGATALAIIADSLARYAPRLRPLARPQ